MVILNAKCVFLGNFPIFLLSDLSFFSIFLFSFCIACDIPLYPCDYIYVCLNSGGNSQMVSELFFPLNWFIRGKCSRERSTSQRTWLQASKFICANHTFIFCFFLKKRRKGFLPSPIRKINITTQGDKAEKRHKHTSTCTRNYRSEWARVGWKAFCTKQNTVNQQNDKKGWDDKR